MIYSEEIKDLFTVDTREYVLAHCISADFALGAGIATRFRDMGVKTALQNSNPNYVNEWSGRGNCIFTFVDDMIVANLVTKQRYWHKPTYATIKEALADMADSFRNNTIVQKKIAMPIIGCGLDGLQWNMVREIIKDTFKNIDVVILVCRVS